MPPLPGRKVPGHLENPVDDALIRVAEHVHPALWQAGLTPNVISMVKIPIALAGAWAVYKSHFGHAAALYGVSYFLDCVDGNMARSWDNVTDLGDWLDHVGDAIGYVAILAALAVHPRLSRQTKAVVIGTSLLLLGTSARHIGCQQIVADSAGPGHASLQWTARLCPIDWVEDAGERRARAADAMEARTKWLGTGTMVIVLLACLVYLAKR